MLKKENFFRTAISVYALICLVFTASCIKKAASSAETRVNYHVSIFDTLGYYECRGYDALEEAMLELFDCNYHDVDGNVTFFERVYTLKTTHIRRL